MTAAAGWYAAFARGLRWGALFAGLAVIVSWIALCDARLDPSPTALRWLFIIVGAPWPPPPSPSTAKASARVPSSSRPPASRPSAGVIGLVVVFGQVVAGAVAALSAASPI